ncbi:transcriptional regulator [Mycobacterium intermedium]|uniref:Transcriptional regulator n=1 Tax=Mycobacterium intermedium TaxID=28445 RepID=A0A1E3SBB1_MYCIE|nr:transcriptional regulator [Mycobacterium intermedium]OPE51188.1 transcriptional regulator [Mycobacterium intermedium]ORA98541.1 transcriptional regulator [Mycobacterium intermedium]
MPENRQAKPIPAERMIRYYTARGLLPRPGNRGRALTYGRKHLVSLVAIKRLQGQGLSLDEIGQRLADLSPSELEALAAIPPNAIPADLGDPEPLPEPSRAAGRFWEAAPGLVAEQPAEPAEPAGPEPAVTSLQAVRLSDTVTLLIDGPLPELAALRRAAAPLLDLLDNRRKDSR